MPCLDDEVDEVDELDDDEETKAEAPLSLGVMIAFYPTPDVAGALALKPEDAAIPEAAPEPAEEPLTLAYFGKLGERFQGGGLRGSPRSRPPLGSAPGARPGRDQQHRCLRDRGWRSDVGQRRQP